MNTGQIIRECRDKRRWTRAKLEDQADRCISTISVVENKEDCKVSTFVSLLNAMGFEIRIVDVWDGTEIDSK